MECNHSLKTFLLYRKQQQKNWLKNYKTILNKQINYWLEWNRNQWLRLLKLILVILNDDCTAKLTFCVFSSARLSRRFIPLELFYKENTLMSLFWAFSLMVVFHTFLSLLLTFVLSFSYTQSHKLERYKPFSIKTIFMTSVNQERERERKEVKSSFGNFFIYELWFHIRR